LNDFYEIEPSIENYWRSIILFGRNVASYKFALAKALYDLKDSSNDVIKLEELAKPYVKHLLEHLKHSPKQITSKSSTFLQTCEKYNNNQISYDELISTAVKMGFANVIDNLTEYPRNPLELSAFKEAVRVALKDAGITKDDLGTIELHDCFTIAAVLAVEAIGFAKPGEGAQFIYEGNTAHDGKIPMNTTGGLIGWGHPVGATGVHMAVTIWQQLTGNAGDAQIQLDPSRPYALSVNMGGDDKTLTAIVYKRGE
jgi:acetyl-CoA C-acetyltransferase/acetyl-CoA acyltransferase